MSSFRQSPPVHVQGGYLVSLCCPLKTLIGYAASEQWLPYQIVSCGVKKLSYDRPIAEIEVHLVVFHPTDQDVAYTAPTKAHKGVVDDLLLSALLQRGFEYCHLMTLLEARMRVLVAGQYLAQHPKASLILDQLFSSFFQTRFCMPDPQAVLLLQAPECVRHVLVQEGRRFGVLPVPAQMVLSRHAVAGNRLLLVVEMAEQKIYGINAERISLYLDDPQTFPWLMTSTAYAIEDMGIVDEGSGLVLLTILGPKMRYALARVEVREGALDVLVRESDAVKFKDLPDGFISPIARVSGDQVIFAQKRGRESVCISPHGALPVPVRDLTLAALRRRPPTGLYTL